MNCFNIVLCLAHILVYLNWNAVSYSCMIFDLDKTFEANFIMLFENYK